MKKYLTSVSKNNPTFYPSIFIFILTIVMIGFSSDGLREFFTSILEVSFVSFLATFILVVLIDPLIKGKDLSPIPLLLFWAFATLMLTIGHF